MLCLAILRVFEASMKSKGLPKTAGMGPDLLYKDLKHGPLGLEVVENGVAMSS